MTTEITHSPPRLQPALKLVFAEAGPGPTLELGPFAQVYIDGDTLRAERGGEVLAEHRPHSWVVKGKNLFRIDCASPVRLHFESENAESSPVYGPFLHFKDGRYWRLLVVKSAASPPA